MIETSTLIAFTLLNIGFALIPGPDVLCILSNSVARGQRAGASVCLGIATGCLFHVACAALGLSAILLAVPTAFFVVKLAGALYLLWLGWQMLRHPLPVAGAPNASLLRSPFVQGVLSNILNPKIAIFFVAILPQFIAPERGNVAGQALLLGLVSIASGTAVNLVTAALGAKVRNFLLARERWFKRLQQAAGCVLIGLGLRVALERAR
jgi:threonine/homoserine/homoserine lactone efflux protein